MTKFSFLRLVESVYMKRHIKNRHNLKENLSFTENETNREICELTYVTIDFEQNPKIGKHIGTEQEQQIQIQKKSIMCYRRVLIKW